MADKKRQILSKITSFLTIITASKQNLILQVLDFEGNEKIAENGVSLHLGYLNVIFCVPKRYFEEIS